MKKEFFAGMGLGLLTGTIIGLSIAEVTGVILGALVSLLTAFFGLRESKGGGSGNAIRIGTFCFACILSIFGGLYLRTHNALSPSLASEIAGYRRAHFDTGEIKRIILFKELGLVPEGYTFSKEAKDMQNASGTVLMTDESNLELCISVHEDASLPEIKAAYDNSGMIYQNMEQQLSLRIKNTEELKATLIYLKTIICEKAKN